MPVYVTEYGVESVPDPSGVSLASQAEFLAISEFLLWRDPWVRSYGQYLLSDDDPAQAIAFQSGLRTHSGAAKPSYRAFPLALAVRRSRSAAALLGAPATRLRGRSRSRPAAGAARRV